MTIEELAAEVAAIRKRVEEIEGGRPKRARKKKCRWVKDPDGTRFWLPECMGGAVTGAEYGCTC